MKRRKFIKQTAAGVAGMSIALSSIGQILNEADQIAFGNETIRSLKQIIPAKQVQVAPTLSVGRTLPIGQGGTIDPFILLDHFGPVHVSQGEGIGVPPHPHRGFEPVTFLFDGHVEHKDSMKNTGKLDAGGIQWMTAGKGIVHSEDMAKRFGPEGGTLHGIQLWVNLPKKDKMADPGYQIITKDIIPEVKLKGNSTVKVVAGEFSGKKGPTKTFTPIMALMIELDPGAKITVPVPVHYNAFFQTLTGSYQVGKQKITGSNLVFFKSDGQNAVIQAAEDSTGPNQVLFLAGEPINEPVYQYGPFVMNSREEIQQAYADYQQGKMGTIDF